MYAIHTLSPSFKLRTSQFIFSSHFDHRRNFFQLNSFQAFKCNNFTTDTTFKEKKWNINPLRMQCRTFSVNKGQENKQETAKKSTSAKSTSVVESNTPPVSNFSILKTFARYLWPKGEPELRFRVVVALSLLMGAKVLTVTIPIMFKHIVDMLAINPSTGMALIVPTTFVLGYGIARTGSSLFSELRQAVFAKVSQKAIRSISTKTFYHLHAMDLKYHLSRQTGALSRAIERGSRGIKFILDALLFNIAPTSIEILLVCGIMGYSFGITYAAITATTLVAYTAYTFGVTQWRTQFRKQMNATENEAANRALDSLLNYETVKYFNNEKLERDKYEKLLALHDVSAIKSTTSLGFLNFGQNVIFTASLTAVMMMASHGVVSGTMTIGDLVMINGLLFQLSMPLNFLGTIYREVKQSLIDMETMFQLLNMKSSILESPSAKPLELRGGSIAFQNVSFGYNSEKEILKNVTFTMPAGYKVGIVGTSGTGKSTILRLLYRFYDAKSGSIKIDDQDIRDVTLESLRKSIGVIPQDTVLFNDSIFYNISYGNPEAPPEHVYEAAKKAQIHDTIMSMPDGYNTIVGERGLKLSGGEKQRVSIARAILKNPSIIFCDEATSSVDSTTESLIQSALNHTFKGRTSIYIAHRLSTIADADLIIVLGPEGILEQGKHSELLQRDGIYKGMWHKQLHQKDPLPVSVSK